MEQIKNDKRKTILLCLLSAGLAGIIFAVFCIIQGIRPFGELSIARNDALHQYIPFLADYINRIKTGSSMLYSWTNGGANQFALVAYYLLSPFNLLALPFNGSNIDIGFWLIILVKTMFIGLTACYYFQRKSYEDRNLLCVAFALIYTFSGFYIAYYYNTMWLDALIMLPLITLGIENIVNGKNATLYFLALAYTIFVNFYLGYMICIFAVIYFFYLLFAKDVTKNADEKKDDEAPIMSVMAKFGFASLFAGLICAVVIVPVMFALNYTYGKMNFSTNEMFFNALDFLSFHLDAVKPVMLENTSQTAPYAISSMLTLICVPAFFCLRNVKPNKKVASAVVIILFYFSFAVPKMNYFWHGFGEPSCLPYRFVFIYLFFILSLAYETFKSVKDLPNWAFGVSGVFVAASVIYTKFTKFEYQFDNKVIIISLVAAIVFSALMIILKREKASVSLISAVVCFAVIAEIIIGNNGFMITADYVNTYSYANEFAEVNKIVDDENNIRLVRIETTDRIDKNMNNPDVYNYNGVSGFSSLANSNYMFTQRMLGNRGDMFSKNTYYPQTPIYNALFSMNYVFDTENRIDPSSPFYEKVKDVDGGTLYKVKYTLPIGYCVNEGIADWDPDLFLLFTMQSQMWESASGEANVCNTLTADSIDYINCNAVGKDVVSGFIEQKQEDAQSNDMLDDHDHDHEHEHEHEEAAASDENAQTYDMDSEGISDIIALSGDVYSIKATADDFAIKGSFTAAEDGEIFALINSGTMQTLTVEKDDGTKKEFDVSERHITDIGYFKEGEKYTLTVSNPDRLLSEYNAEYAVTDSVQMSVASINEEKFVEGYNQILKNGVLDVDEFEDTYIHGTVNSTVDGYMMMPMPYDEGWTVYVDGEPVELHEHESHILMFEISKGEHEIEMSYFPQGLKEGIFISLAAVLGLVLVLLLGRVHKMKLAFEAEEAAKAAETDGEKNESEADNE